MVSGRIRKGKASVEKQSLGKFVNIIQDNIRFHASYEESPNGVYLVAFNEGHLEIIEDKRKWVAGQVCLVKNLEIVLWRRRITRPNDGVVSNNGIVAINDWTSSKYAGGKFYVFDINGKTMIQKEFNSNLSICAISKEGNNAIVSTASPDNRIHFWDVETGKLEWSYYNHSRRIALGLSISDGEVQVFTGRSTSTRKYDYSLNFKGELTTQSIEKLRQLRIISKGNIEESINMLIAFLRSPETYKVRKGLKELRVLTHRFKNYGRILAPYVSYHLLDEDEEISKLSEEIILKFGERDPDAIEPAVKTILMRIEKRPNKYREIDLRTLGMLGKINPYWIENLIPIIIDDLKNNSEWNARRFAAFALGQIGSTDSKLVKEAIPVLTMYLGSSDGWLPTLEKPKEKEFKVHGIKMSISLVGGPDKEVWIRDASISALGYIGENNPELIKNSIPMIVSCLKKCEHYTRKCAIVALGLIAKKNQSYLESAIPTLEKIAKKDSDDKVKVEAKKLLNILSVFLNFAPHEEQ